MNTAQRLPGRTASKQLTVVLKRASDQSKYSLSGRLKEGAAAPARISLPTIRMPMAEDSDLR